jgi:hypothetical protein
MADIPNRDITGNCDEGECRDRVREGEEERQAAIATETCSEPSPNSTAWTRKRGEQPATHGGAYRQPSHRSAHGPITRRTGQQPCPGLRV